MENWIDTLRIYENGTQQQIDDEIKKAIANDRKAFYGWLCAETLKCNQTIISDVNRLVATVELEHRHYHIIFHQTDFETVRFESIFQIEQTVIQGPDKKQIINAMMDKFLGWLSTRPDIDAPIVKLQHVRINLLGDKINDTGEALGEYPTKDNIRAYQLAWKSQIDYKHMISEEAA